MSYLRTFVLLKDGESNGTGRAGIAAVRAILDRTGAVRRGHFLLTSGLHTELFLLCAQVMQYPHELTAIAVAMAAPFRGAQAEEVGGPAVGGIILAYEVARQLNARGIFAEKSE